MPKYIFLDKIDHLPEKQRKKKEVELKALQFFLSVILQSNDTVTIHECSRERPDFKIRINDSEQIIGVEHTECHVKGGNFLSSSYSFYMELCKTVVDELKADKFWAGDNEFIPNYFVVKVNHDKLFTKTPQKDKDKIKDEFKMLIEYKSGKSKRWNTEYIADVSLDFNPMIIGYGDRIDIQSNMLFLTPRITEIESDPVIYRIEDKESKLSEYKNIVINSEISQWWLIIQIPRTSFLNICRYSLPDSFTSNFDKIFLIKDYSIDSGVINLYDKSR